MRKVLPSLDVAVYHATNSHPFLPLTFSLPYYLGLVLPLAHLACETQNSGSSRVLWLSGQGLLKVTGKVRAKLGPSSQKSASGLRSQCPNSQLVRKGLALGMVTPHCPPDQGFEGRNTHREREGTRFYRQPP